MLIINNTTASKTSTYVWRPTPVDTTTDVQDEDECAIISKDDNDVTLTEEEIGNLFQDAYSENDDGE